MESDLKDSERTESPSRWLKVVVLVLVAVNLAVLVVNAATTTIWEDEANGYFLARQPLPVVIKAMANNVYEDPPLYDIVLHGGIGVFGYHVPALRGLSIFFWCLMLPGLFLATRRLAGSRTAWLAVGIACLLPNHWLFPASMRWYSLFSCLSMWNFYFFLGIYEQGRQEGSVARPIRIWAPLVLPYAVTGAALWYTNYSAPILFFSHLVVSLIGAPSRRRVVAGLVAGWCVISVLYLPWVPTFLSQMGQSVHSFKPVTAALSLWVLAVGEFFTPLNPWFACFVVLAGALLAVVVVGNLRQCWMPPLIMAVALMAMMASGVIWTKRVMFLVPLLAMTLALALQRRGRTPRWLASARTALVAVGLVVVVSSFAQMARRESWVAYRWLDPIEMALERAEQRAPRAVVLTNSNPALFYLQDELGKAVYTNPPQGEFRFAGLFYPFADHLVPHYEPRLKEGQTAVYLHHWAYGGALSSVYDDVVREMKEYGFEPDGTEAFLSMPPEYMNHHKHGRAGAGDWTDSYRVALLYFKKPPVDDLAEMVESAAEAAGEEMVRSAVGTAVR